ncbi:MAG: hypothetical protein J7J76_07135 [Candidatus Latescibacteria bacterium]|nr:hypothetical protein [Candidatus Latescibacterota bacterium]
MLLRRQQIEDILLVLCPVDSGIEKLSAEMVDLFGIDTRILIPIILGMLPPVSAVL